jgi:glycosyltransferase involved in cell wall biosynthesis
MIILSVHNSYQQPGGEDEVFRQEARLLERHGHKVVYCQAHNDEVKDKSRLELLGKTIFSLDAYNRVRTLIDRTRPDVMHVHNTFPLLSPAVYYAAADSAVPVVQTLHNYRLLCPAGVLFRNGNLCELCLNTKSPWPAVQHKCYRDSRAASAAAASMLTVHRMLRTYKKSITTYIALSEFTRCKFIEAGIPQERLVIKPNFVDPDPGRGSGSGGYCLFVGRLSKEKGIHTLLDAWTRFSPQFPLEIAGDGDLAPDVEKAVGQNPRIRWHGRLQKPELYQLMKNAAALIVPSTWYEPFGIVLVEAFAMGLPVIASKLGAMATMVEHQRTGLHFTAGDPAALADQVNWFHGHSQAAVAMREQARLEFELRYTGEQNYSQLMEIYRTSIDRYGVTQVPSREALQKPAGLVQIGDRQPAPSRIATKGI